MTQAAAALVFVALVVTAAVGVTVVRTDGRRFDHRACAAMAFVAVVQATIALSSGAAAPGDFATSILPRLDAFAWALNGVAAVAFVVAFPLGRPPGPSLRWVYGGSCVLALALAVALPPRMLGPAVGTIAICVGVTAIHGGILQVRRLSHPRGASARLIAAAAIIASWLFVGAAVIFVDAVTTVAPTPAPAPAARCAPLLAATLAGFATAHYALVGTRRMLVSIATWLAGAIAVLGVGAAHRLLTRGVPDLDWDPDFGLAALTVCMLAVVVGVVQQGRPDVDERAPSDADIPSGPRETLVALDRLTDPLAVQERVVEALTELLPGAKLELLRARIAPPGTLTGAREVPTPLALAAVQRGWLLGHQIDELSQDSRIAFAELGGALIVPVRCGPAVFGVLRLDNLRVDRGVVMQARRFADLLGYKLETHRLYAELETHRRLASLGTLATALAHDLRTPLSAIRMNIQMLQMRRDVLGDDAECLEIALVEVDRLNAQISTLLDFARPMDLDVGELDLGSQVAEAVARVSVHADAARVELRMEVDADLPRLPGDPSRFSRVLVNLIDNAVQASPKGAEVRVHAFATSEVVDIVVRDRGRGIASEDLPRIFDPFFTTRADGTGLGLAICRKIVQAHGGQILVSSEPGSGTELRVRLPRRRPTPTDT